MSDISNSVKDYGAKGDGITDDTGAFRRALMQEGEVTVPDGMYVITGELPVSRLCQGISSDRCGGIILARHPEWGYDFARYFRSTIIVPTTVSYRLKCAALEWAIKICAKAGRIPDWLYRWKVQLMALPKFYIKHLTIIGVDPATHSGSSKGGIYVKSHYPHVLFTIYGNHFMTNDWWAKSTGEKE
jgi:hypothetical protein